MFLIFVLMIWAGVGRQLNWRVSGMRVIASHDGYGSDHRPILVQLSPAG